MLFRSGLDDIANSFSASLPARSLGRLELKLMSRRTQKYTRTLTGQEIQRPIKPSFGPRVRNSPYRIMRVNRFHVEAMRLGHRSLLEYSVCTAQTYSARLPFPISE